MDRIHQELETSSLTEHQRELVEAAWEDCLEAVLEGEHSPIQPESGVQDLLGATSASLAWIEARGFRGIAQGDRLKLPPGVGLTLVLGRNGSGKSSYAEALEVALRGQSSRWEKRTSKEWTQGWANLHYPDNKPVHVRVGFHVDQQGEHVLERRWASRQADVSASTEDFGALSLDALGWREAVETTPPILSYSELGRLADRKPSELYDALERLLGLEQVQAARDRLVQAQSANEKPLRDLKKKGLPALNQALGESVDPRARTAEQALASKPWDLEALDELALGIAEDPDAAALRSITQLRAPSFDDDLPDRIRASLATIEELSATQQAHSERLASLLDHALAWHAEVGDASSCPLCESPAVFDDDWRSRAEEQVKDARASTQALRTARRSLQTDLDLARRALTIAPPAVLAQLAPLNLPTEAAERWTAWNEANSEEAIALADALEAKGPALASAVTALKNLAAARLDALEESWKPLRSRIAAFAENAQQAQQANARVPDLKKAKAWIHDFADRLREERFAPIADRATQVWSALRANSNVELDSVRLSGQGNRRHLELKTMVDDTEATALGVMSQGEINALGLALFVPRAMSDASPFRFLVVDDPVQAMDPHKVDGLAGLLSELAKEKQVVVFTHDPRLREALERMQLPYQALEVQRDAGSVVKVEPVVSPVEQYLKDAFRVYKAADHLGETVVAGLVPAHCRNAVEAACAEAIRRRRIKAGHAHADVDALINDTRNLNALLALAFFDNEAAGNKVAPRLKKVGGESLIKTLKATKQAHGTSTWAGSWADLVNNTRKLTDAIRSAG